MVIEKEKIKLNLKTQVGDDRNVSENQIFLEIYLQKTRKTGYH